MANKLHECITELQKNHTDKEISGALSEYFQIVKGAAVEYTDEATVRNLRDDHPELDFMDDDELEDILKHAKTWRHKTDGQEPAQPEHEPDETDERLKRMEEFHRKRMEESKRREKALLAYAYTIVGNRHYEAAALLSALGAKPSEAKYKDYWDCWGDEGPEGEETI